MALEVLVVDDHPLCREALCLVVKRLRDDAVISQVETLAAALTFALDHPPDAVLLDLILPDCRDLSGLLDLRAVLPGAVIVLVSGTSSAALAACARDQGASAFISKSAPMHSIVATLQPLLAGGGGPPSPPPLTRAQQRVLEGICDGHPNKQIAHDLRISVPTVKAHAAAAFRKLGVVNRTQAALALASQQLLR